MRRKQVLLGIQLLGIFYAGNILSFSRPPVTLMCDLVRCLVSKTIVTLSCSSFLDRSTSFKKMLLRREIFFFNISYATYPVFLQGIVLVNGVSAILYQIGLQLLLVKHNISRIVTVMTLARKLDHAFLCKKVEVSNRFKPCSKYKH